MRNKKRAKCYYCGDPAQGRYTTIEGKYRVVCMGCLQEARNSKMGYENKAFSKYYNRDESFSDLGLEG